MSEQYYVATDAAGVEHRDDGDLSWTLPASTAGSPRTSDVPVRVYDTFGLLDALDEVICIAVPSGDSREESPGVRQVATATLTARTMWNPAMAAAFALDCSEHVLGEAAEVELPNGVRLDEVIADARSFLSGSNEPEARLGRLARLATIRRLRRSGAKVGDAALGVLTEDGVEDRDATDDPAWTLLASAADAVLATVEALRHVGMPRYATEREEIAGERDESSAERSVPQVISTPWGGFATGAEHDSPYMPASHLAQEAAFRARETVRDRGSDADAERLWQAARLQELLATN